MCHVANSYHFGGSKEDHGVSFDNLSCFFKHMRLRVLFSAGQETVVRAARI